jgi:hypothetical protein
MRRDDNGHFGSGHDFVNDFWFSLPGISRTYADMPRLFAILLIALTVVASAVAHASAVAAYAAPAPQAPTDATVATAATDMSVAQSIGSSGAGQALQIWAMGCTQSSASLNCAFLAALPQHHSLAPDQRGGSMLAIAEESALAGLDPPLWLRPPIPFS